MASRPRAYLLCFAFISVFRGMRKQRGEAGGAGVSRQISLTERASCVLFAVTVPCFPRRVEGAPPALRALLATPGLSWPLCASGRSGTSLVHEGRSPDGPLQGRLASSRSPGGAQETTVSLVMVF